MTTQNEILNCDNHSSVCSYHPQRQIISHAKVAPESRRAFLGKAASVMLAALGAQPLACRHKSKEQHTDLPQQTFAAIQKEPTKPQRNDVSTDDAVAGEIPASSDGLPSQTYPKGPAEEIQPIVHANNEFALELYAKLRGQKGNLFFSPFGIYTALAIVCAGARGQTEAQMVKGLNFPVKVPGSTGSSSMSEWKQQQFAPMFGKMIRYLVSDMAWSYGCELNMANALWIQKDYEFRKEFLELVQTYYGGYLQKVDFKNAAKATCMTINRWVEANTNQKIKELIAPDMLDALTRLVLTNAIYFKCNWEEQFYKELTQKTAFTRVNGRKIDVLMMNQTAKYGLMETEEFQALELPYVGNKFSMVILLPRKFNGLYKLERILTLGNLSQWLAKLEKRNVAVSIPKLKMTHQLELVSLLQSIGIKDVFSVKNADLSGITGQRELFLSQIMHKAFVDVNEKGTEAVAITGVVYNCSGGEHPVPISFRADHPFIFLIRDNYSGNILFFSRVMEPPQ